MKISRQFFPSNASIVNAASLLAISLLPLVLLVEPGWQFGADWLPHLWLTSYFAEYFKYHFSFPEVINTDQLSGMPYPVFYGFLVYPILGLLSVVMDPGMVLRIAVATVFLLQSSQVFRLILQVSGDRILSLVTTATACWSTYALTNLYNRGALNELMAVALLTSSVCLLCRTCLLPPDRRRLLDLGTGVLFFALAAGTHPITALFGGIFGVFLLSVLLVFAERRLALVRCLAVAGVATALVLSPWAYAVLKFGNALQVSQVDSARIEYLSFDTISSRLMPVPYDIRTVKEPKLARDKAPYLETQITAGLLILALFFSGTAFSTHRRGRRLKRVGIWMALFFWALFLFLLAWSVIPALGSAMPALFRSLQFAYRLVSYLNLCLLLIITGCLVATSTVELTLPLARRRGWVLAGTLALALFGLAIKLNHGTANAALARKTTGLHALYLPFEFYGANAYAITNFSLAPISFSSSLGLRVGRQSSFGLVEAAKYPARKSELVWVNVQPFPWNELSVDGRSVADAGVFHSPRGIIVPLEIGEHEIKYTWRPDRAWVWLNRISRTTLVLWIGFVLTLRALGARKNLMGLWPPVR